MGIAVQHSPRGAQQYNGAVKNAIQRCIKIAMAFHRAAARRLRPGGFLCVRGLDARGDELWAEPAKDAAQKLNQAASLSNPGRASPQELFTGKNGAFLVVPFFSVRFHPPGEEVEAGRQGGAVLFPQRGRQPCRLLCEGTQG